MHAKFTMAAFKLHLRQNFVCGGLNSATIMSKSKSYILGYLTVDK